MFVEKRLKILDANLLFFIAAILFFTVGYYFQNLNLELGLVITQYLLILLPPIIYILLKKIPLKKNMRLNKISIKHALLVVIITLLMYPAAVFANAAFMLLLSFLGNLNIPELPTATTASQYVILMLIISVSAGICEEFFFRGFMLSGYENLGKRKAIIITSILFGLFHFNLYNLFGPIVLGLTFSYLVTLTDSLFAGIIGHMVNNGFAVTLGYIANIASNYLKESQETTVETSTSFALFVNVIFFGAIAVITVSIALKLIKIIKNDMNQDKNKKFLWENNFEEEGQKYVEEKQDTVSFKEWFPLILVVPLYLMTAFLQLREIISLG